MNITSPEQLLENGKFKGGILSALKSYLFLETVIEEMRPTHVDICNKAIEIFKPVIEDREAFRNSRRFNSSIGSPINSFGGLHQASDEVTNAIYTYHKTEMAKAGYKAEGAFCPWLVAKNTLCQAERLIIDVMEKYTQVSNVRLHIKGKRDEYLKTILKLLVSLASREKIELNIIKESLAG